MDQQGVGPLAASALLSIEADLIPEDVRAALRERVQLGALRAGIQVPELLAILEALEARGVAAIAHKGQALSMLAYGRTGVRDSVDLDLVVRESDVTAAEEVLRAAGLPEKQPRRAPPAAGGRMAEGVERDRVRQRRRVGLRRPPLADVRGAIPLPRRPDPAVVPRRLE